MSNEDQQYDASEERVAAELFHGGEYDFSEVVDNEIWPLAKEIHAICLKHGIPMAFVAGKAHEITERGHSYVSCNAMLHDKTAHTPLNIQMAVTMIQHPDLAELSDSLLSQFKMMEAAANANLDEEGEQPPEEKPES